MCTLELHWEGGNNAQNGHSCLTASIWLGRLPLSKEIHAGMHTLLFKYNCDKCLKEHGMQRKPHKREADLC